MFKDDRLQIWMNDKVITVVVTSRWRGRELGGTSADLIQPLAKAAVS
jgi:hypothetical protein